ncbi:MAG: hypothetical protein WD716_12390 [Fimbriimonadaceae bacterium]
MISCNLTKPESTFDQVRKAYENLKPIDVALVATAIVECGHFAKVVHDGNEYSWPDDQEKLAKALVGDVQAANESEGPAPKAKKVPKAKAKLVEETIIKLSIPVKANQQAGEALLGKRKDLKTLLGDILKEGVEYLYTPTDIRWRWSLERVNWSTVSGGELPHHVIFSPEFSDSCVGIELGPGGKRKKTKKGS